MAVGSAIGSSLFLFAAVVAALAGTPRTPVKGTPRIADREVPRFVLLERIDINRNAPGLTNRDMLDRVQCRILPGQFVPVSEDAKGVYFQAANGVQGLGSTTSVPGGLYASKTRAERVYAYIGDARQESAELLVDAQPIAMSDVRKLQIGRVGR
jgi:hypothetical protein